MVAIENARCQKAPPLVKKRKGKQVFLFAHNSVSDSGFPGNYAVLQPLLAFCEDINSEIQIKLKKIFLRTCMRPCRRQPGESERYVELHGWDETR